MTLGDLLPEERIVLSLEAGDVEAGFRELTALGDTEPGGEEPSDPRDPSRSDTPTPRRTEERTGRLIVRVGAVRPGMRAAASLGVLRVDPSTPSPGTSSEATGATILLALDLESPSDEVLLRLRGVLADPDLQKRILAATSASEVRSISALTALPLNRTLRVRDVMVPLTYRVFPDTPVDELLSLVVRRHIDAVPVVGEGLQVLGIITAGDLLRQALPSRKRHGATGPAHTRDELTARDIMSRSVMCVDEGQPLLDAATVMANRDVAQMPVVREGEIVGFLTRDGVLTGLFGPGTRRSIPTQSDTTTQDRTS
jgi:CBS domain-containing protein